MAQPLLERIATDKIGLEYYSKLSNSGVALAPWDELQYLMGCELGLNHLAIHLYSLDGIQRAIAQANRGTVIRFAMLIYNNGEPIYRAYMGK